MTSIARRVIAGLLGLTLSLALGACGSNDDGPTTTAPGGTDTTEPVGS